MTARERFSDPRFHRYRDLFNKGKYFEAHEALEPLWLETRGRLRDVLQGLVQIAVALEHHRRGNRSGALAVLRRAGVRLEAAAGPGAAGARRVLSGALRFISGGAQAPSIPTPAPRGEKRRGPPV